MTASSCGLEDPRRARPEHEDADGAGGREDRHEGGAPDADALELLRDARSTPARRRPRTEPRPEAPWRRRSAGARDPGSDPVSDGHVPISLARGDEPRRPAVRIDERERGDVDAEERRSTRPRRGSRSPRRRPPARGRARAGRAASASRAARSSSGMRAPASRRRRSAQLASRMTAGITATTIAASDGHSWPASGSCAVDQHADAENRGGEPDRGKDERERHAGVPSRTRSRRTAGRTGGSRSEIQRREEEQRHRVEQHRLGVSVHWRLR